MIVLIEESSVVVVDNKRGVFDELDYRKPAVGFVAFESNTCSLVYISKEMTGYRFAAWLSVAIAAAVSSPFGSRELDPNLDLGSRVKNGLLLTSVYFFEFTL